MTNKEYMEKCAESFRMFVGNNYDEFRNDRPHMRRSLERAAHDIGAGIRIDGTEQDAIAGSYSNVLVRAFIGTDVGIPVSARMWNGWLWERVGRAYTITQREA